MTLVIAVIGCRRTVMRLATVRAGWGAASPPGVEVVYFVGAGPEPIPDWVTPLDAPDDYASLPIKVHGVHQWLTRMDFDWMFKCDDDTYVATDRLVAEASRLTPDDFLGSSGFYPVFASGGAGYLMHRRASRALAEAPPPEPGPEDVFFSLRLRELGYVFRSSDRLRFASEPQDLPTPDNAIVTCHWLTPLRMRRLHDAMTGEAREAASAQARFVAAHGAWSGEVRLFGDGFFTGGVADPDGLWNREADRLWLRWFSWPEDVLEFSGDAWRNAQLLLEPA